MKKIITLLSAALFLLIAAETNAQNKQFKTSELHFGVCPGPAEEMYFTWDEKTGKVSEFYWNHGGEIWFLYTAAESIVVKDDKTLYDYNVYLRVTTKGYETTPYMIRAKMTLTAMRPDGATFGGIYEGTGTYWICANGTYVKK